jgi:hypothetical protein
MNNISYDLSADLLLNVFLKSDLKSIFNYITVSKQWLNLWQKCQYFIFANRDNSYERIDYIYKIAALYRKKCAEQHIISIISMCKVRMLPFEIKTLILFSIQKGFTTLLSNLVTKLNKNNLQDSEFVDRAIQLNMKRGDKCFEIFNILFPILPNRVGYLSSMSVLTHDEDTEVNSQETFHLSKVDLYFLDAIDEGRIEIVSFLLDNYKHLVNKNMSFGLSKACMNSNIHMADLLIKNGANVNHEQGWVVYMAQLSGKVKLVKLLLDNGANPFYLKLTSCAHHDNVKMLRLVYKQRQDVGHQVGQEEFQETFDTCLLHSFINSLNYLYKKRIPMITEALLTKLCMENKIKSLKWLRHNNLLPDIEFLRIAVNVSRIKRNIGL